ncbi:MAG TPA: site-specific integrase [Gemmataceae bacterium]|nr:site-specific integrase [Gemmataceae bacterium]
MARKSTFPSYRRHKQSGQAVVTLNDPMGRRRDVLLGPYGSPESKAEYARVIGEWQVSHHALPGPALADITVNELLLRFWGHVEEHYRHPDGTPTTEVENFRYALKPLRELYGHTPAGKFGPLALKAVRQRWVNAELSRRFINQRVGRIKRMFKWAVAEELVPAAAYQALQAVEGLKQGRTAAKDRPAVQPVPAEHIDRVLPFLRPQVRAMIELQRLTGMRPGEVCRIRWGDIDQSGEVWVYRPGRHKTAYRGRPREVLIGPRGQEILGRFEKSDIQAPIFSPREAVQALQRERVEKRVTKYYLSRQRRQTRKAKPKRQPADCYSIESYGYAVARACRKASVPVWYPYRLRHTYGTEVRKEFGLEAAQVLLGHTRADVTQVYAEANRDRGKRIAARIG